MPVAKVTSKGQITIPKQVRERMGLKVGDQIEFIESKGHTKIRKKITGNPFEKWKGFLKDLEGKTSDELVEEMRGR
jgi:AbrB family looped-hinge helix DNA binding protein